MTATTIFDYYDVLRDREFTPDEDGFAFHSPGRQVLVTVTDGENASVNVAARSAGHRFLLRWEVDIHGAPPAVLDAAVRAAEPSLTAHGAASGS